MKAYPLTSPQQTAIATLNTTVATTKAAYIAANAAVTAYLATAAGVTLTSGQRLTQTSDGTSVILQP
jgi:hypothetical protein